MDPHFSRQFFTVKCTKNVVHTCIIFSLTEVYMVCIWTFTPPMVNFVPSQNKKEYNERIEESHDFVMKKIEKYCNRRAPHFSRQFFLL